MQTVGQTASLTGTTIMLSVVRLVGPEDAERSYQPVWALCAGLGLVTFLTACTLSGTDAAAGTPRAAAASSCGREAGGPAPLATPPLAGSAGDAGALPFSSIGTLSRHSSSLLQPLGGEI